jgi:hypothetical protein
MLNTSVIKRKLTSRVGPCRTMTSAVATGRSQPVDVNYVRNTLKWSNLGQTRLLSPTSTFDRQTESPAFLNQTFFCSLSLVAGMSAEFEDVLTNQPVVIDNVTFILPTTARVGSAWF